MFSETLAPSAWVVTSRRPDSRPADAGRPALVPSLKHLVVARLPHPGHHIDEEPARRKQAGQPTPTLRSPGLERLGNSRRVGCFYKYNSYQKMQPFKYTVQWSFGLCIGCVVSPLSNPRRKPHPPEPLPPPPHRPLATADLLVDSMDLSVWGDSL